MAVWIHHRLLTFFNPLIKPWKAVMLHNSLGG